MTKSWSSGWPAFAVVAAVVIGVGLLMDAQGVQLSSAARVLYSFVGIALAVLAGVALARFRQRG